MRIGYFGGAFNPPTVAHIELAKKAISEKNLDKVVFVPVSDFYKKDNLLNIDLRIKMLELACNEENEKGETLDRKLEVSDIERNLETETKAIDIFEILEKENKTLDNEIYFLMGYDNFEKMPMWKNYDKLKKYNYIVFERNNNNDYNKVSYADNKKIFFLKNDLFYDTSSSLARKQIATNKNINNESSYSIKNILSKDVIEFIFNNDLY